MKKTANIPRKRRGINDWLHSKAGAGVVFTAPFTIGFLCFLVIPMLISLYYSFTKFNILSAPEWIGLGNYVKIFTKDPKFYNTLFVTLKFAFISVPLRLAVALLVALILVKSTALTGFYRAAYYLPSIVGGSVAIAVLWKRMFAINGTFNMLLTAIGIPSNYSWLGNAATAMGTLVLLACWQFGSSMLIFLASLKQIPVTLYEAARVDGARKSTQFFRVTLPLLTPTIFFNLVMQMINGFLAFTQCLIITQGKPLDSTLFYTVYMYKQSFEFYNAGYGSALAWIMLMVVAAFTGILFILKKYWVYDGGF